MPRQTRRSAKAREAQSTSSEEDNSQILTNGNGSAHHDAPEAPDSTPKENIFLFWPNIIGMATIHVPPGQYMPC